MGETLDFFSRIGVLYKVEDGGRVYPYSDQASAVLDSLRRALAMSGVNIICGFDVRSVKKHGGGFIITPYSGSPVKADKVIISSGGKAAPDLGSNGGGYELLKSFGHSITSLRPSLVQLKTRGDTAKRLKGIKVNAKASLGDFCENGEVLFTDYGLSGPAVFSLTSRYCSQKLLTLDIMSEYSFPEVADMLFERRSRLGNIPLEDFFTGMLNKRVGQTILKAVIQSPLSRGAGTLTDAEIRTIASVIKKWGFEIEGTMSWNNAQVTKGGARTDEFDPETMESKLERGLFAAGEVLDIDGDCGGYNLQWAWSSGYIAGKNA